MYHIWDHTFYNVLGASTTDPGSKVMLTSPPLNPTRNRMRLMETMFERYGFSGLSIQVQAGLVLYAQGNTLAWIGACSPGSTAASCSLSRKIDFGMLWSDTRGRSFAAHELKVQHSEVGGAQNKSLRQP